MSQLCLNEGDLQLHRIGGDASDPDTKFTMHSVPEVFNLFDDLSFELAKMDLTSYRQSCVGQQMLRNSP